MEQRLKHEIDEIDIKIIKELARDGRMPVSHLAEKASITQHAARDRLNRIIKEGIIKIVVVPAPPFSKQSIHVSVGLNVTPGRSILTAAEKVAAYPNFRSVVLATGPYDIISWAFFSSIEELSYFLRYEIGKIPEITSNETLIHLETIKSVLSYPISADNSLKYEPAIRKKEDKKRYIPDELDMSIVKELQKDARITIIKLAKKLGVNRVNASKRLQQLLSEGIIEVIAVTEPGSFGYEMTSMIGIKVRTGKVDEVAYKLASFNVSAFRSHNLGTL